MRHLILTLMLLLPSLALADMIPPMPPMKCATGSTASNSHNGAYCSPSACSSNDDCEKGQSCQMQGLCISFDIYTGRSGGSYVRDSASAVCSAKKECSVGQCEVTKRCVPKGTKASTDPENRLTPPDPSIGELGPLKPEPADPKPEPTPDSQPTNEAPDSNPTPDSSPTPIAAPPTKVDKGRCSVSPTGDTSALVLVSLFTLSLVVRRRRS